MVKRTLIATGIIVFLMANVTSARPVVGINGEEESNIALAAFEIETLVNIWNVDQAAAAHAVINKEDAKKKLDNTALKAHETGLFEGMLFGAESWAIEVANVLKLPYTALNDGNGIATMVHGQKLVRFLTNGLIYKVEATIFKIPCLIIDCGAVETLPTPGTLLTTQVLKTTTAWFHDTA